MTWHESIENDVTICLLKRDVTKEKYSVEKRNCESEVGMPRYLQGGSFGAYTYARRERRVAASRSARHAASAAYRARSRVNVARRGLMRSSRSEWKSVETYVTPVTGYDGAANCLALVNPIARGDDINERTGRQVIMKSVEFRADVQVDAAGVDQTARVLLVYDKQTNASALTAAQVFHGAEAAHRPFQMRNLENRSRFTCLMDKTVVLNAAGESGSKRSIKFYRKLNLPVTFNNGDGAGVADIVTGSLYIIATGTEAAGATDGSVVGYCRVRYEDK